MTDSKRHPFLQGLSKHRGSPPTAIVIFGASGDLAKRKLLPAIYNLSLDNLLPTDFHLVGYGRRPIEDSAFREQMGDAVKEFSRRALADESWQHIADNLSFHAGGYDEEEAYRSLAEKLNALESKLGRDMQFVFYISTPPSVFGDILKGLGDCGLADHHRGTALASKVVIEKPFGRDLDTAAELNNIITNQFDENQVYRIDHYLGKETVQDLLVLRFANGIFEPLWNRQYVNHVQITVAESLGVGSRGGYYDKSGALRDMLQNHTMQLLSLISMEPPVSLEPEAIRDEKVKVLKAIQPLCIGDDNCDAVRARYIEGMESGQKVKGYLEEENIPQDSFTETYAALKLSINNWRWKGVPFYMRSGKRMARRVSEIAVQFKRPPGILFSGDERFNIEPNTMVIRIQPDEGITLVMNGKVPGLETRTQPVRMHFGYATTYGSNTPEAYERLILDAMVGDSTLFIRGDEAIASWKLVTPLLQHWESQRNRGLMTYAAGSWGPDAANELIGLTDNVWRKPGV